jgi:hypothetical protein
MSSARMATTLFPPDIANRYRTALLVIYQLAQAAQGMSKPAMTVALESIEELVRTALFDKEDIER